MKSPRWVWSIYLGLACLATLGLSWITYTTLQSEAARQQSNQALLLALADAEQAKLALQEEQRINEALWLADSLVAPLLANETSLPWQYFDPFLEAPKSQSEITCSPLVFQDSPFIHLHFQVRKPNAWSGPLAIPQDAWNSLLSQGVALHHLQNASQKLQEIQSFCSFSNLLAYNSTTLSDSLESPWIAKEPPSENLAASNRLEVPQFESQQARSRQQAVNSAADNASRDKQILNLPPSQSSASKIRVQRSPSRVVWINQQLLQVRRIIVRGDQRIQGAWFNWPALKAWLEQELQVSFPGAHLDPVPTNLAHPTNRLMVSLPLQLSLPLPPTPQPTPLTTKSLPVSISIGTSLAVAWLALLSGLAGAAWILHSALTLSDRRATFVSAVSHELRTPLTTFQLYTDLLMSRDDLDPAKRTHYLHTLQSQADRLARLVENVLAYSRLDGRPRAFSLQSQPLHTWLRTVEPRLLEVAQRYQANLLIDPAPDFTDTELPTQPELSAPPELPAQPELLAHPDLLEQTLLNLVENSCKYGLTPASRVVHVQHRITPNYVEIDVIDHGIGVPELFRRKLFQPFSRSAEQAAGQAPGIGLGLSLARRLARAMGGDLQWIESSQPGSRFRLYLKRANDRKSNR